MLRAMREVFKDAANIALFAYVVLPHYFTRELTQWHYELLDHLEIGQRYKHNKGTMCFRGFGKTTIQWVLATIYEVVHKTHPYILINAWDQESSIGKLTLVREEFETNEVLELLYPGAIGNKDDWNRTSIVVYGDVQVGTISTKQNPRGKLKKGSRPTKIVSDDIIDDKNVLSMEQRQYALSWYNSALMPALASRGVMEMLNTPLHHDDIICTVFSGQPPFGNWDTKKINLEDEQGNRQDGGLYSDEYIEALKLDQFTYQKEMMNNPLVITGGMIAYEDLRFYNTLDNAIIKEVFIHADTTHTAKTTSDYFAIAMAGRSDDGKIFIIDYFIDKIDVEAQANKLIEFVEKAEMYNYRVSKVTYDEKSNQGFGYWAKDLARRQKKYLPLEPLKWGSDKVTHFQPHVPLFKSNSVYLPEYHKHSKIALDQLTAFPQKGVHDDFIDALSGVLDNFQQPSGGFFSFR